MKSFLVFSAIGALGFFIDGGILTALVKSGAMNPYAARLVSFPAAVLSTWALNRRYAFSSDAESPRGRAAEYGRYVTVQVIGAGANLVVYGVCLFVWPRLASWPVIPLAVGALAGLLINYAGSRFWVFAPNRKSAR